jgi:hypothetical protein
MVIKLCISFLKWVPSITNAGIGCMERVDFYRLVVYHVNRTTLASTSSQEQLDLLIFLELVVVFKP